MKYLNFIFLLLLLCSLQPYDRKYVPPCSIYGYYFNNGKLIKVVKFGDRTYLSGDGIKSSHFYIGENKRIITDSIVYKIK